MSSVEEIYQRLGQQSSATRDPVVNHGDPNEQKSGRRYKLTKKAILKALATMPDEAALWGPEGMGDYDAKVAMRDALWKIVENKVTTLAYAPDGKTLIEVR